VLALSLTSQGNGLPAIRPALHVECTKPLLGQSGSLDHLAGTWTDGEREDFWTRATVGMRKTGDGWKVTHEHTSVPFYMDGTPRPAFDLRP
jgi:SnoaL-like domain